MISKNVGSMFPKKCNVFLVLICGYDLVCLKFVWFQICLS